MAGKIYVSYRTGAELKLTRRLIEHLKKAVQHELVLYHSDHLSSGAIFPNTPQRLVRESGLLLAIITEDWANVAGTRRLDNVVRIEVEEALQQGKRVIPVLMENAQLPLEDQLPKALWPLAKLEAVRVTSRNFHAGSDHLVEVLQRELAHTGTGSAGEDGATPEIPHQGYGPHFEIGDDGVITFAPPGALDRHGNNVVRLNSLHPSLRELSSALVNVLGKGNVPYSLLHARAEIYHKLIDQKIEGIDFALLYMAGVRLANAEKATTDDNELPPLPPSVREAVDSLLQLHGTFILASIEGIETIEAEQRYQRTRQEEAQFRSAALDLVKSIQDQPKIIDPQVAATVLNAVEEIGKGANPDRSGTVAIGALKNLVITLGTAATLGTLSAGAIASGSLPLVAIASAAVLVAAEGLKKSKPFAALAALVTQGIDKTAQADVSLATESLRERFKPQLRFFLSVETYFKRLAGGNAEFAWLTKTIPWLKQQTGETGRVAGHDAVSAEVKPANWLSKPPNNALSAEGLPAPTGEILNDLGSRDSVLVPYMPLLRRYGRMLLGDEATADRYLTQLVDEVSRIPDIFNVADSLRWQAFKQFNRICERSGLPDFAGYPDDNARDVPDRSVLAMSYRARQVFLLLELVGFSSDEVAKILDLTVEDVERKMAEASRELTSKLATRVLVIEPHKETADRIVAVAAAGGHTVLGPVGTAADARQAAWDGHPGLVIAEIQLSDGSSGLVAVNEILEQHRVPAIFVTAYPERFLTGPRPEPAFLISKPFDETKLAAVMVQALLFKRVATSGNLRPRSTFGF